mmetsp:Transcript_22540/g.64917  ORF Transcript_22540/g.64917 Transcript_22540/m.64917 type:complete len:329 (+) Transcript_22540:76-1062(+)
MPALCNEATSLQERPRPKPAPSSAAPGPMATMHALESMSASAGMVAMQVPSATLHTATSVAAQVTTSSPNGATATPHVLAKRCSAKPDVVFQRVAVVRPKVINCSLCTSAAMALTAFTKPASGAVMLRNLSPLEASHKATIPLAVTVDTFRPPSKTTRPVTKRPWSRRCSSLQVAASQITTAWSRPAVTTRPSGKSEATRTLCAWPLNSHDTSPVLASHTCAVASAPPQVSTCIPDGSTSMPRAPPVEKLLTTERTATSQTEHPPSTPQVTTHSPLGKTPASSIGRLCGNTRKASPDATSHTMAVASRLHVSARRPQGKKRTPEMGDE